MDEHGRGRLGLPRNEWSGDDRRQFHGLTTGTDGTHLVGHEVGHFTVTANGDVTVSFDRFT